MKFKTQRFTLALATAGLVATLALGGAATAAPGGGPGHRGANHAQRMEKMQAELGLTADQVSRIKAIKESNAGEMKSLHEQMKATFTPEQQAQMKAWREQRKAGGERMTREQRKEQWAQLGLSEGQQQQLKSYREQIKSKRENIHSQIMAVLTPEQQAKMEAKKAEFREKHKGRHRGDKKPG